MKVVVAIDSFKGCLSSDAVEAVAAEGIAEVFPDAEILCVPVADGGEGTAEVLAEGTNGQMATISVHNPLMRPVMASYGISGDGKTAVVEMSAASGLTLLTEQEKDPFKTTTFGTGELILDAIRNGYRHFILGVGGSATNDAGVGMFQALGFRFLDSSGCPLGQGGAVLPNISRIDDSLAEPKLKNCTFDIASDVRNPLYGPEGAAFVFARQKGGTDQSIPILDNGLRHFAEVIKRSVGKDISGIPGAGAGGGFAGGCIALLNARIVSGITMVLHQLHFEEKLQGASFVITGEGRMDAQTLQGKVPAGVSHAAACRGIPVYAIAGQIEQGIIFPDIVKAYLIADPPVLLNVSMQPNFARNHIRETAKMIAMAWSERQGSAERHL